MYLCDICKELAPRRMYFLKCRHSSCPSCLGELIWGNKDEHFLCCHDPTCPICEEHTDIIVETYEGGSRTFMEERITYNDKKGNDRNGKDAKK